MDRKRLKTIIDRIKSVKIAVVGDFCLDAYWYIDKSKSEISLETSKMTVPVRNQKYTLGGAGNVSGNLAAMGVNDLLVFGVIGTDPFGTEIKNLLQMTGINTENLLVQEESWSTHVYSKPYIEDEEQNRIDFGNFNRLSKETANSLISKLKSNIPEVDLVIINQQVLSGIHTDFFKKKLAELIKLFPDKIFVVDCRNYSDYYQGAYRKINETEAAFLCGLEKGPDEIIPYNEVREIAKKLYNRYRKPLFITRGKRGSVVADEKGVTDIFGLMIIPEIDTVGAGDSYLSGAASTLAAGFDMESAAEIGTFVSGVTIQKLFQTGTASPEEILQIGKDPDYIYYPELAEDTRHANYISGSEIEVINTWPENLNISHAIFDHDGTISTLREGWEQIMVPMMMKAVLGKYFQEADEALYHKVLVRVTGYIDKTTGIQTLVQMKGLVDLVIEFGCVPEDEILDESGYKQIYNDELSRMVNEREKKIILGELSLQDFSLKNAVLLLEKLNKSGVKLYLASGTDEEDVKKEARVLGYDHLFEGRIYGAVGDVNIEAKKIVLDRIMQTIGESGTGQFATFGDGPVEIRETKKRGGITIGIASNEQQRHGLNERKRTRLIKAGADIIIPDFSQLPKLLKLLNISD